MIIGSKLFSTNIYSIFIRKIFSALSDGTNPFQDLYYWSKGELNDFKSMQEAIIGRNELSDFLSKQEQK